MDMLEISAMTEASGLVHDPKGATTESGATPGGETSDPRPPHFDSRRPAMVLAERLRDVTVKAPLQSLSVAFLLGIWVARRR